MNSLRSNFSSVQSLLTDAVQNETRLQHVVRQMPAYDIEYVLNKLYRKSGTVETKKFLHCLPTLTLGQCYWSSKDVGWILKNRNTDSQLRVDASLLFNRSTIREIGPFCSECRRPDVPSITQLSVYFDSRDDCIDLTYLRELHTLELEWKLTAKRDYCAIASEINDTAVRTLKLISPSDVFFFNELPKLRTVRTITINGTVISTQPDLITGISSQVMQGDFQATQETKATFRRFLTSRKSFLATVSKAIEKCTETPPLFTLPREIVDRIRKEANLSWSTMRLISVASSRYFPAHEYVQNNLILKSCEERANFMLQQIRFNNLALQSAVFSHMSSEFMRQLFQSRENLPFLSHFFVHASIKSVDFSDAWFTNPELVPIVAQYLNHCPTVQSIAIDADHLSEPSIVHFFTVRESLTSLSLTFRTAESYERFQTMPFIKSQKSLSLNWEYLVDEVDLTFLSQCKELSVLCLKGCNRFRLSEFPASLSTLSLYGIEVSDTLDTLLCASNLRCLDLQANCRIDSTSDQEHPHLERLTTIASGNVVSFIKRCPNLKALCCLAAVVAEDLIEILATCRSLETVSSVPVLPPNQELAAAINEHPTLQRFQDQPKLEAITHLKPA